MTPCKESFLWPLLLYSTLIRDSRRDSVPGSREDGGEDEDPGHVAPCAATGRGGHGQQGGTEEGSSLDRGWRVLFDWRRFIAARRFIPNEGMTKGNLSDMGGERSVRSVG